MGSHGTYGFWRILLAATTNRRSLGKEAMMAMVFYHRRWSFKGFAVRNTQKKWPGFGTTRHGWHFWLRGGGFKHVFYIFFLFFPQILGEMIQFWRSHIFQLGWLKTTNQQYTSEFFFKQKCQVIQTKCPNFTTYLGGVTTQALISGHVLKFSPAHKRSLPSNTPCICIQPFCSKKSGQITLW